MTDKAATSTNYGDQTVRNVLGYLEYLAECMPGNFYWKDDSGRYLGCNSPLIRAAGLPSADKLIGKTDAQLWPEQAHVLKEHDRLVMETGEIQYFEECVIPKDGPPAYYTVVKMPLKDQAGNTIGIIGNSINITHEKEIQAQLEREKERAEEANKAKSHFLAMMSHELRTPLNAVLGMAQILMSKELTHEQQECIEIILDSGKHLLSLINNTLDFSKLEAGKLKFEPASFDLQEMLEETITSISHMAKQKEVEILLDYEPGLPTAVYSDAHHIRLIVINLLSNAIKFTNTGHIIVSVGGAQKKKNSMVFCLSVSDTGIGISRDMLEHVFKRFTQLDPSLKRRYEGTGLGLAICKQLTDSMGGRVEVDSLPGKGSTFSCHLPFTLQAASYTRSTPASLSRDLKMLIVDDDEKKGAVYSKRLSDFHVEVVSKQETMAALLQAQQANKPYDWVIVDEATKGDSFDLSTKIRDNRELTQPLLALLTQNSDFQYADKIKQAGYFTHFVKPVYPSEFVPQLASAWGSWKNK